MSNKPGIETQTSTPESSVPVRQASPEPQSFARFNRVLRQLTDKGREQARQEETLARMRALKESPVATTFYQEAITRAKSLGEESVAAELLKMVEGTPEEMAKASLGHRSPIAQAVDAIALVAGTDVKKAKVVMEEQQSHTIDNRDRLGELTVHETLKGDTLTERVASYLGDDLDVKTNTYEDKMRPNNLNARKRLDEIIDLRGSFIRKPGSGLADALGKVGYTHQQLPIELTFKHHESSIASGGGSDEVYRPERTDLTITKKT